jgi:hypothetical protein
MPNTEDTENLEDTKKLLIFVEVVDKPEIHVGVYSTPPGVDEDGTDHIVVSLNKANAAVLKSLEESDTEDIIRLVNWVLIHDMTRWTHHYPHAAIREHVWKEAGKTKKEMDSQPGFFDIAYKNSPLLKRVADLPIFGAKAENAQTYGAWKLAEIDIPEITPGLKGHPALWA